MKPSKVSENVLKRSVLNNITSKNDQVLSSSRVGADSSLIDIKGCLVTAINSMQLWDDICIDSVINRTVADLFCQNARPLAIGISLVLPNKSVEGDIKKIIRRADGICRDFGMQIALGDTSVSAALLKPLFTVTAYGDDRVNNVGDISNFTPQKGEKGDFNKNETDIVLAGRIATDGTALCARLKGDELRKILPAHIIDAAAQLYKNEWIGGLNSLSNNASIYMHNVSSSGIYGALWEFASYLKCGISVNLRDIPLYQESVEVSEALHLNPYMLLSSAMLFATSDAKGLIKDLNAAGVFATHIGKCTDSCDKILLNNDEVGYLSTPQADDIYQVLGGLV